MPFAARICLAAGITLAVGCGAAGAGSEPARASTPAGPASEERAVETASAWLTDVPRGGTLTYEVTSGEAPLRVQMQVQEVVQRGSGIAIRLAPIGTPLDDEPIYPRWIVGEPGVLVGLDATAALTTEAGYAPIDERGRIVTEATENISWRLPREWLTPGRVVAGEEASAGWRLSERVGEVSSPVAARGCARLERVEAGGTATLLVCENLGMIESTRSRADGQIEQRWQLVAVEGPRVASEHGDALE
ncbi:MAG: hypothetical protein M3Y87_01990 [Myxococcota bacterium]|nr:hypothetical protein [Myxococcota bacterium]